MVWKSYKLKIRKHILVIFIVHSLYARHYSRCLIISLIVENSFGFIFESYLEWITGKNSKVWWFVFIPFMFINFVFVEYMG